MSPCHRLSWAEALLILGFAPDATPAEAEIVQNYRAKARDLHPDRDPSPGATARFQQLQSARDLLLSEETAPPVEGDCGPRRCPRCDAEAVPPPEQPWLFRCGCGAVLRNPAAAGDLSRPVTCGDVALAPGTQGELRRFTGAVPPARADACVWRCKECPEDTSVCCRVQDKSRCVCGHLKRGHRGVQGGCSTAGCACATYKLHPCVGAWQARCRCKHHAREHDPRTGKCGKLRCGCTGISWAWVCNCGHAADAHETVCVAGDRQAAVTREWVAGALRAEVVKMAEERRDRWAKTGSAPAAASYEAQCRVAAVAAIPRRRTRPEVPSLRPAIAPPAP
eukprot:Hpha_TRINITY_DN15501_c4_g9::TRINITY_DN15501_c4_g9_i1::g.105591::m.105591